MTRRIQPYQNRTAANFQSLEDTASQISNHWKFFAGALLALSSFAFAARAAEGIAPFAVAATPDGHRVYVSEAAAQRVVEFDPVTAQVLRKVSLDGPGGSLVLSPFGSMLYVAEAAPQGRVLAIDTAKMRVQKTFDVGHTPSGIALSPEGARIAVCNRFDNNVQILDTKTGKEVAKIPMRREPISAVWTPDGSRIFVGNHLPVGAANGDYVGSVISVIDCATMKVSTNIALPNGSTAIRQLCVSADGKFVYATHLLGHYQLPTTQLERGWMYVNTLTILDAKAPAYINTVLLDDVDLGAANPWGVAISPDGKWLCVAHAGSQEISIIDRAALHDRLDRAAKGEKITEVTKSAADVVTDLSFVYPIRRRVTVAGNGPRGITVGGDKVFTAEYFTDSIGAVSLTNDYEKAVSLPLGKPEKMSVVRRGEMIFDDAARCFQHWQSCQSCHPDTRADALNWDLLNDGIGNPKNVKSMLLSHKTPPAMWLGVRDNAEVAVRSGFKYIQFAVVPDEDACAVDTYLKSLEQVQSPHLVNGRLSSSAKRGKEIYKNAGCAECHPSPLYTDLKSHEVGTSDEPVDAGEKFDTPTLAEIWRTAPYFHDGRAATLEEMFTKYNSDNKHGATKFLTKEQLHDLIEYVSSL